MGRGVGGCSLGDGCTTSLWQRVRTVSIPMQAARAPSNSKNLEYEIQVPGSADDRPEDSPERQTGDRTVIRVRSPGSEMI